MVVRLPFADLSIPLFLFFFCFVKKYIFFGKVNNHLLFFPENNVQQLARLALFTEPVTLGFTLEYINLEVSDDQHIPKADRMEVVQQEAQQSARFLMRCTPSLRHSSAVFNSSGVTRTHLKQWVEYDSLKR